ncbi:unnamed protein product [Strongylus vulgaris]|uniref:Uncharacterized protein n=1 Tax=Strongylus vulgaris TaxID=40348 RepID=A0A3P7K1Q8_STRVU|nr:unnamed protein product [Strongylus vulgaris]
MALRPCMLLIAVAGQCTVKRFKHCGGSHTSELSYIRHSNGHVTCDLCTEFKGLQRVAISRRAGELYQRTRSRRDGELFPLEEETVVTEKISSGVLKIKLCFTKILEKEDQCCVHTNFVLAGKAQKNVM